MAIPSRRLIRLRVAALVPGLRALSTWVSLLVLACCGVLWCLAHQPMSHDCAFHGAGAHIIKDDSGFRMVAESHSVSADAVDLRQRSLAVVFMEPRFEDGTELDPVRTLRHAMLIQRGRGAGDLPDMAWIRSEFSKVVANHGFCMAVCPRSAELVAQGDGPTELINWGGCGYFAVVVGAAGLLVGKMVPGAGRLPVAGVEPSVET